jgi:cob(I)alamin adenosyltransferase
MQIGGNPKFQMTKSRRRMRASSAVLAANASKIPVYTRTGDRGTSSLFNGERAAKSSRVFDALGASDELNAHLGLAHVECGPRHARLAEMLSELMSRVMDVGSNVATPASSSSPERRRRVSLPTDLAQRVERWIDELDEPLPPLRNFVLPGGCRGAAQLHVARTVCRRLERTLWALHEEDPVDEGVLVFANRMSDWLFVAARHVCFKEGVEEVVYKKAKD